MFKPVCSENSLTVDQIAIHEEAVTSKSIEDITNGHPMFINVAVHYLRPKQTSYIREALQGVIRGVIESDDVDLETDPSKVRASCQNELHLRE